jgi:ATP-binding cassette, subfamily B (MDR/TAP), member 1
MAFDGYFRQQFDRSLQNALRTGVRGAFVEGCNVGVASGLIYLAEALLFWDGAVLVARQIYSYLQMVQVLQLVVFSVSIASQLLAFSKYSPHSSFVYPLTSRTAGGIAKAIHGTRDLDRLLTLSEQRDESLGKLQPEISGNISFKNVTFAYPELKSLNLDIKAGECIALVGGSGSGKSTVISLLQRLYQPTSGQITIDGTNLAGTDVTWLRDHVSIVTQKPQLFDMTVIDNIAYGPRPLPDEACYEAAQACNAEEFILNLPDGYETQLGANAEFLSGGQAQRLAIARALVRGANVLILDECTSALDAENEAFVMDSIKKVKQGRTIIMITHKVPLMRMCDRVPVVHDGTIAEEGTYDTLINNRGIFSQLASGGEWAAE